LKVETAVRPDSVESGLRIPFERRTAVKRSYHVVAGSKRGTARTLAAFCRANGQVLLPLVELVEQARLAVDTVIEQISQQALETILDLSAEQLAGARTPGKPSGPIRWHGRQTGRVSLADRQLAVNRPRRRLWLNDGSCVRLRPERANHV
jgi:hypothetical protein